MKITRKYDLSKFGMRYENIEITTNEHDNMEGCLGELQEFVQMLYNTLNYKRKALLEELKKKQSLTAEEAELYEKLKTDLSVPPF